MNSTQLTEAHPLINGKAVQSTGSEKIEVVNPSDGSTLFELPSGTPADVDHAVSSARVAFDRGHWSAGPPSFRRQCLQRFAELIECESADLDALDACEMGKPISTAAFNAAGAGALMRFNAELIDKITGDVYNSDPDTFILQRLVPRGVVAAVVPWNFPTFNAVLKIAPALAGGNCVVLKPSELASRSAIRLGQLALQSGIPEGVLNVVPGAGETVGSALGLHSDVDMIAFTGSSDVGKLMLEYSGRSNMKVVQAECGGKSPHIVFDDGLDLDEVSAAIAGHLLTNQGQICSVGSRLLVQRTIERTLVDKIAARMGDVVVGDALVPQTTFGPVASAKQLERVMRFIATAREDGAELVIGGVRINEESGGFFVAPTLFRNVPPVARIAQQEIFGPVLSVIPFDTVDEAISIANGTVFGLAAYVWTTKLSTGMRLANAVRSMVLVNAAAPHTEGAGHAVSYEPSGQSGLGVEGGLTGMTSYMRRQLVWFNHS
ncbi:aldehyde dehydrogenase family protein [Sphingosinicella microcystinivorans]|uniref:Gamma-glutamyl-gamma-aminobutyraldehyde dehydrogenase n=1 Tax=Sphingosinicella microcystinivorans TaxID=335406 RepID=A0AAD1G225_SPHMI|nr:aldehyde dehydrogenase family protein [Sphingosinicella microcystinivorans]RKS94301.1 gamma-glutamyl-gamma-aminobutyraldehyde dehydrogenase [Sphingosinicella microcystinivorans]BBE35279.1 gamma-glutamyl-gamma-aminobutyraldehyde dehydrogenase [Sphingosinicella microcystinivorans]